MPPSITDAEADKIGASFAKHMKGGNSGANPAGGLTDGSGKLGGAFSTLADKMNPLSETSGVLKGAFGAAAGVVKELEAVIKPNLNTWRELSASGANFDNDIVSMSAAAAGARLDLGEFADLVKKNTTAFTGLGGNVAAGAKAFASLSKDMQDSGAVDQLKAIGMTSKDANDALALTLGNQFTVNLNDAKSKQIAIESATKLATEMDLMSKLTGKTRQEQEELMKKTQQDAQFQSKLQLDTMGMSEEKALEYRNKVTEAYNKAQMEGMGDVFKEVYATGTVQTEAAANKFGLLPEQAGATQREIDALRKQDYKTAGEEQKNRELQISKDAKDRNKLQLITLGETSATFKTLGDQFINTQAIAKSYASTQKELADAGKLRGLSEKEQDELVKKTMDDNLKKTQESNSAGAQSTKALVQLESRAQDVNSAFLNGIVKPVNEKLAPSFEKLNTSVLNATGSMKDKDGKPMTKVQELEHGMKAGGDNSGKPSDGKNGNFTSQAANDTKSGANESSIYGAGKLGAGIVGEVANGINGVIAPGAPKKEEGGVVPGTDKGTTVTVGEKGKPEAIVPLDQLKQDKPQGINVAEIAKTVSTTISSAQGVGGNANSAPMSTREKNITKDYSDPETTAEEIKAAISGAQNQIKSWSKDVEEQQNKISQLKEVAAKRELSTSEEYDLQEAQRLKGIADRNLAREQDTVKVLSNLDEYKARLETESKQKTITATESAAKISEETGLKQVETAKQTEEAHTEANSTLTEGQRKLVDDYKGFSEKNRLFMIEAQKNGIAEDTKTVEIIGDRITKMKADIGNRQATEEEKAAIENEELNKGYFEKQIDHRKEMLDVMQNLGEYTAKREIELKQQTTAATEKAVDDQKKIQSDAIVTATKNAKETVTINGKIVDPDSPEAKNVKAKMEAAQKQVESLLSQSAAPNIKMPSVKELQEQYTKMSTAIDADPAKLKELKGQLDTAKGMPDFSTMFGGEKGKQPDWLSNLNAKTKDLKPVPIQEHKEENKTGSKSAAQAIKTEQQKKEDEEKAKQAQADKEKAKKEDKPKETAVVAEVTLKDVHTSLEHLNKSMASLLAYSQQTATAAQQQVKATKSLTSNKFG